MQQTQIHFHQNQTIKLSTGEKLLVTPGHLLSMSSHIQVSTRLGLRYKPFPVFWETFWFSFWGFWKNFWQKIRGKDPLSLLHCYEAKTRPGEIVLGPSVEGDIFQKKLKDQESIWVLSSCFLAATPSVLIRESQKQLLRIHGPGTLWLQSVGAHETLEVDGEYVLSPAHLLAFEESLSYCWIQEKTLSKELQIKLMGTGKVFLQTRSFGGLLSWVLSKFSV